MSTRNARIRSGSPIAGRGSVRGCRAGYSLLEVVIATSLVAVAMGIAFQMMSTISNFTEDEIRHVTARTDFDRIDTRLYDLLAQSRIEVDGTLTPAERLDLSWIEFRVPADTGDGNGLQNGASPDLRWGAPKLAENRTATHGAGVQEGKLRVQFVPSYEIVDEAYETVASYKEAGNVYHAQTEVYAITERIGTGAGMPQEGSAITFTTVDPNPWTVYNCTHQNLNSLWERNTLNPVTGVNPTANFGRTTRYYLGLLEIRVILFKPGSTTPKAADEQPKPVYYGGVMDGATGRPLKGSCYLAVSEAVAFNAIADRNGWSLAAGFKLDEDMDGDGRADPLFTGISRWYQKDATGAPIGDGAINGLGLKFMVLRRRTEGPTAAYDVFRSERKIAFRNPLYSIQDAYSIADLAPPAP